MATPTAKSGATSNMPAKQGKDATALVEAIEDQEDAAMTASENEPAGALATVGTIPDALRAQMSLELQEALRQIEAGFGDLSKPTDVFNRGQEFWIIDGFTIPDYEDKATGEVKTKHIFRCETAEGLIFSMMQSDARPRRVVARALTLAAGLGGRLRFGPYKLEKKKIVGQIQDALIFVPQAGFKREAFSA